MLFWLLLPVAAFAGPDEFYERMQRRGMSHFAEAEYATAFVELRSAAFGFVDDIEKFEKIHAYAALAANRLGHASDARDSLLRIAAAEKIEPHFSAVTLPENVRAEVNRIAARLLTRQESALIGVPKEMQDAAAAEKSTVVVPTPSKRPNVAVTAPREQPDANAAAPPVEAKPSAADSRLADAQRAVDNGDVKSAQAIYDSLLSGPALGHETTLRLAEGFYRVRDFAKAARAFERAGAIGSGEERYHFYYAVALYETGHFRDAKRELAVAIPFITATPDVARYRAKIEGAAD